METSVSSSSAGSFSDNTATIIVLGMAGSGKSAFVQVSLFFFTAFRLFLYSLEIFAHQTLLLNS